MSESAVFGQLVIGPPGSGKTTYCAGLQDFLQQAGRSVVVVNLDPANDNVLPYKCDIDISQLITLQDAMETLNLGPNGGLVYCMEYLQSNLQWLLQNLQRFPNAYFLFDCPGQVELYTHHNAVHRIAETLRKNNFRMCAVHLVDSHYCSDPGKFVSVLLTSLSTMLRVELPHINVLSKVDLIGKHGKLRFNIDFYTDVLDLSYLLEQLEEDPFTRKYKKLNEVLIGVIDDYSLVSFVPLNIQDKNSVSRVIDAVDKANGYIFGSGEQRNVKMMMSAASEADFEYFKTADVREKYLGEDDKMDDGPQINFT